MTATPSTSTAPSQAYVDDRAHVFHSWSAQAALDPLVVVGAEGSRFWDDRGNSYLDFARQLVNAHTSPPHPTPPARGGPPRLPPGRAPGALDRVFFTSGGAEATENAMRMARLHTGRHK